MYNIQKNLNRLLNGQSTFFLDKKDVMLLKGKLHKDEYKIYYPYPDSEKVIFYNKNFPEVLLYEIKCFLPLKHQDILGTIYSLQISNEMFGDIIVDNGKYYIYILKLFQNYFEANFTCVKNSNIELILLDVDYLCNYRRKYEELKIIVSSERIDTIISRVINTSRSHIEEKFKNNEILYNEDYLKKLDQKLKVNDTFSIRKIGKFKYNGIIKNTKSNNYIVSVYKYI